MAKKSVKSPAKPSPERIGKPVRLNLSAADHDRLERCARERGLNKASYARQAVLERIKHDEGDR